MSVLPPGWLQEELAAASAERAAFGTEAFTRPVVTLDNQVILDALDLLAIRTQLLLTEAALRGLKK